MWWRDDETDDEVAERARRDAEAEERERQLEADRERRLEVASAAGYRYPRGSDHVGQWFDCPTCGALVTLSGVERHIEWHSAA